MVISLFSKLDSVFLISLSIIKKHAIIYACFVCLLSPIVDTHTGFQVQLIVATFIFLISIPIGMSLGYSLNNSSTMVIGNRSLLEILDQIVTSVLIPVSALFIALSVGWFMYKPSNKEELFSFKFLAKKLEEDDLGLGKITTIFAFMIKYVAPLLILGVDIVGLIDNVFPNSKFALDGLIIEIIGLSCIGLLILIYFLYTIKKDTGDNESELVEE